MADFNFFHSTTFEQIPAINAKSVFGTEMMYLSASAFDEALKKEQEKTKELEDKYNEKIVEHSVSLHIDKY